ncbi:MAG: RsmD family RNA methyltransferase [Planctomycetaceae bacterium]|jgi:16S rRNA (guanine966-N2)-methyltransferase|nr:RsmD family RNA methyltransferase [Planctomycetaceae bacterium]
MKEQRKKLRKKNLRNQEETFFEIDNDNQGIFVSPESQPASKPVSQSTKLQPTKLQHAKPQSTGKPKNRSGNSIGSEPASKEPVGLRIIGGRFRGSKLQYIGDNRVRPMKDRVREAVFNLIGTEVRGRHVIDLFAGTGALTIEAISRGAVSATVIELHFPTATLLRQNLESLGLLNVCDLRKTDAFFWAKNQEEHPHTNNTCTDNMFTDTNKRSWLVFCSPPYDFYVNRQTEILEMLQHLLDSAPTGSLFVIESDNRFNFDILPVKPLPNKIKSYPPAEIAIFTH